MLRRGDVWWADFGERRPVLLLGEAADGQFRCVQIVEPAGVDLTGIGLEVPLGAEDGLPLEGVVRVAYARPGLVPCTWLATVTEEDVLEHAGTVSQAKLDQVEEILRLGELPPPRPSRPDLPSPPRDPPYATP
ncbi:hypothetical protein GCM10009839_73980 [Catenulispora yoronensis]|uniref:mRNA interferase MazF n=1 Tax=Catenulispora yoronensis TaxID=450799 RepID=A0ABP5GUM5_9ACTN